MVLKSNGDGVTDSHFAIIRAGGQKHAKNNGYGVRE
jgi:hypothetical protein